MSLFRKRASIEILLLVILPLLMSILWFGPGLLFGGGEDGLPFYNLIRHQEVIASVWYESGTGLPIVSFLPRLPYFSIMALLTEVGIPSVLLQATTFFLLMSVGVLSVYFILQLTLKEIVEKYPLVPFIGGLFYLFNPFSMSQIWGRGLYFQFFSFALVPFFLLCFILGLKHKNYLYIIAGLAGSIFFSTAFEHISQVITIWIPILLYFLFYVVCISKKNRVFPFVYLGLLSSGWLATQAWWILSYISISSQQYAVSLSSFAEHIGSLQGVSRDYPFLSLIRLLHNGYFFGGGFDNIYENFLLQLVSFLIPLISIFSFKTLKENSSFLFFSPLFLLGLFICLGSNFPSGFLFESIFLQIPLFQVFRNPFEKFGIVLVLAFAPFFAIGLHVVSERFASRVSLRNAQMFCIALIMILVGGLYLWPYWTKNFAGGLHFNAWVSVPDYYWEANDWLNEQAGDFRIVHLPLNPGDGLRSTWENSYQGTDFFVYMFDHNSVSKNLQPQKPYYNVLLDRFGVLQKDSYGPDPDIAQSTFRSKLLSEELAKLNVRYVVLHHDFDLALMNQKSIEENEEHLKNDKNIEKVKTFGDLDIYQIHYPENVKTVYSPDTPVTYSKIDASHYSVSVANAESPFSLYLLNTFDTGWDAAIDGTIIPTHNKVFSYANSWEINKTGSFTIDIQYKPQKYLHQGIRVSFGSSIIVLLGSVIYASTRRYYAKK